jgi:hypothetical protein
MTCWNVSSGSVFSVTTNAAAGARELTIRRDTEGVTDVAAWGKKFSTLILMMAFLSRLVS